MGISPSISAPYLGSLPWCFNSPNPWIRHFGGEFENISIGVSQLPSRLKIVVEISQHAYERDVVTQLCTCCVIYIFFPLIELPHIRTTTIQWSPWLRHPKACLSFKKNYLSRAKLDMCYLDTFLNCTHFSWDKKHTISARWLANLNRARIHLPHQMNFLCIFKVSILVFIKYSNRFLQSGSLWCKWPLNTSRKSGITWWWLWILIELALACVDMTIPMWLLGVVYIMDHEVFPCQRAFFPWSHFKVTIPWSGFF